MHREIIIYKYSDVDSSIYTTWAKRIIRTMGIHVSLDLTHRYIEVERNDKLFLQKNDSD